MDVQKIYASSDRDYLLEVHKLKQIQAVSTVKAVLTYSAPNRSFPRIPINKSAMITIGDILRAGPSSLHQGKILFCRSIMPVVETAPFMIELVIDEPASQRCLMLEVFNFPGTIRPGTILAVMHPWFKQIGVQTSAIRVENLQHVHIFNGNDPLIRGLDWKAPLPKESGATEEKPGDDKEQGNRYFEDKNYLQAVEAYSRGIQAQPENAILYSNRAMTYLRMEQSEKALQDTEIGLKLQPSNVKLLYRKAKALIQLKRYEEAASFLEKASEEHKGAMENENFADLVKASKRMVEEAKGNYNILEVIDEMKRSLPLDNHADYYAMDKFEVKEVPGKGRGLVAKEKIEAGTLLMAIKAFVFADKSEQALMVIDQVTKIRESLTFPPLVQKASQKLLNNPELGDDFYKLYAGKKLGWLENADHLNPVDIDRIADIIRINSFGAGYSLDSNTVEDECGAGIWIMATYMNHSCVDNNCFNFNVGDFLFVRAFMDIQPGEELLVQYVYQEKPFEQRRQDLNDSFQMECLCRLCQSERIEPEKVRKRMNAIGKILDDIDKNGGPKDVVMLEKLLEEVKKLRPNMDFNYVAHRIQRKLFAISPGHHLNSAEELFSIYQRTGHLQMAMISAKYTALTASLGKEETTKWMEKAKDLAKILYGDERAVDLYQM